MTDHLAVFKRYCLHTFLRHLSLTLFFAFGALLIYSKTQSIFWVLVFGLVSNIAGLFMRSFGIVLLWRSLVRFGAPEFMAAGLALLSLSFFGLFFLDPSQWYFPLAIVIVAVIHDFGAGMYWIPSNAILFETVGALDLPGKYSSLVSIVKIVAVVLGAVLGLAFDAQAVFLWLFPVAAIFLLASIIPLKGIPIAIEGEVSLRRAIKSISPAAFWGNIQLHIPIRLTVLPLVVFLVSSSISISIWVTAIAAIGEAFFAYLTGKYKDGNKPLLIRVALVGMVIIWIMYAVARDPFHFILLGVLAGILENAISVGREARLSREVANALRPLEATIAVEIARSLGPTVTFVLLLVAYHFSGTMSQALLFLGAVFVVPIGLYASGVLEKYRGAV